MAYQVHNYKSGDTLKAAQLNQMDAQIARNEADCTSNESRIAILEYKVDKEQGAIPIELTLQNGYLASDGTINPQVSNGERTSQRFALEAGSTIHMYGEYTTQRNGWAVIGLWKSDGTFVRREQIVASSEVISSYNATYTIPDNIAEIAISYRSYNEMQMSVDLIIDNKNDIDVLTEKVERMDKNANVKSVNHRGYNTIAPENTLSAFKLSKQKGFDYVETDVYFTSDNVPVCIHDATIDRTSNGSGDIRAMTFAAARQYDFGSWKSAIYAGEKIPSLEEFVGLCKKLGLHPYIEIRNDVTAERAVMLVNLVKKYGMIRHVTWISSTLASLENIKAADAKARLGYIVNTVSSEYIASAAGLRNDVNDVFIDCANVSTDMVNACVSSDVGLEMWTINTEEALLALNPYVSGFTSDSMIAGVALIKNGLV